jgi:hypothetical protein
MCSERLGEAVQYDIEDHPDLKDAAWMRAANRRAKREIRRQRRQARMTRHGRTLVLAVALIVISAVLFGLSKAGKFGQVSLPEVTLPRTGVDIAHPFQRTPAEQWADGEKGIVAPDQDPEYAPLYETVRKALVAGHLDPVMVVERNRGPLFSMLVPHTRGRFEMVNDSVLWTRTKEGTTLLPVPVKVDGRMWPGRDEVGRPIVHTSYRFAYAFDPGDRKDALIEQTDLLAMVRADIDFAFAHNGISILKTDGYQYLMACQAAKEGYLAPSFTEQRKLNEKVSDRRPDAWFASDAPMPSENGCD